MLVLVLVLALALVLAQALSLALALALVLGLVLVAVLAQVWGQVLGPLWPACQLESASRSLPKPPHLSFDPLASAFRYARRPPFSL